MIDLALVETAFETVRARAQSEFKGAMITGENLPCCMTCGFTEIEFRAAEQQEDEPEGLLVGYAFYHEQDTAGCLEGGDLWLCYGALDEQGPATAEQVADLIVGCLREAGFTVEWDGSVKTRICVKAEVLVQAPEAAP